MGSYLDIIYCIILFAFTIYNAKVIYRNYKHEQSLGTGYSNVVDIFGTIFLLTGSIFITNGKAAKPGIRRRIHDLEILFLTYIR